MKQILTATLFLFASIAGFAQCTPPTATGTPGVTPAPNAVTCIERGVPYSITMNFENFTTIGGIVTVDSVRIDSLTNFPCGITWQSDKQTYYTGETGCILVSGTSNDAVGQYPLKIYMTVSATTPFGSTTQSGEINSLIASSPFPIPLGFSLDYVSRVIDSGDVCPPIDTNANMTACGPVNLTASITGGTTTAVCPGAVTTLTASAVNRTGAVTYAWSTGETTQSITVSPTATMLYTVTVTDQATTATASKSITVNELTTAAFTVADSGAVVTVTSTSTDALSYRWDFGDDSTSFSATPAPHTYTANGTYTITLITTNACGSDTATQDVTISIGVSIKNIENNLNFEVAPNPSNGAVTLNFSAQSGTVYDLQVFDLSGKNVFAEKITATSGNIQKQLNLTALPKGVYTMQLSSGNSVGVKKLQIN